MNHINKPSGFNPMESYQQYPSEKYGNMGNRVALQQDNIHQSVGKVTISEKAEVALSVVHKSMTQKFSNFENFNSEIEKIENEIINNFDFEAAAKSVMSFVNASLNEAKSRGASTNELQSLLGQARIGANQGIDEAIGELSELNVLDDDLHEGIEKARDLINIGLDKTEKNISNDKPIVENSPLQVSKTKELSTNNYISQSNTSDLSITTADGDTVNISFSALKESQSSHYYRYGIDNNKQVSGNDSKNVCIFAEGEVDRCPTGSGVSGRMAIHKKRNEIKYGETMTIESITGSVFKGSVVSEERYGAYNAVIPEVEGTAHITGVQTFLIDPNDPMKDGFILR